MSDLLDLLVEMTAATPPMRGPWPHFIDGVPAHGIVSMDPPTVECDRCHRRATHPTSIHLAVIRGGMYFNPRRADSLTQPDRRRLCRACAWDEWDEKRKDDYGHAIPRPQEVSA